MVRLRHVNKMEELMLVSSFIITKAGGLTVTEALTRQLPLLIYKAIPGQEEANADFLIGKGAGRVANSERELSRLLRTFLENPEVLEIMRDKAGLAVPSNSAETIVGEMFNHLLEEKRDQDIC